MNIVFEMTELTQFLTYLKKTMVYDPKSSVNLGDERDFDPVRDSPSWAGTWGMQERAE